MKVKATQPITKLINNYFVSIGSEYRATLEKLTPEEFTRNVNYNLFENAADYNTKSGRFQAIRITYPAGYYAIDKYITTSDLVKAFRRSDKTATDFLQKVYEEIEI